MFKVGEIVNFKKDVEGRGVVKKVSSRRNWMGETVYEYLVGSDGEPNGYQFHPEARFDYEVNCMVVYLYEEEIF